MTRSFWLACAALAVLGLVDVRSAQAQAFMPRPSLQPRSTFGAPRYSTPRGLQRPTVSPYLNLVRPDVFGPLNYQLLVRPQIEQRYSNLRQERSLEMLGYELQAGEADLRRGRSSRVRETGHVSDFMNYSHFYRTPESTPR